MRKIIDLPNIRPNYYYIHDNGTVEVIRTGKIMSPYTDKDGYLKVSILSNVSNKKSNMFVHRIVALMFIHNDYNEKDQVNHIDGNKQNPCIMNLEWCTISENRHHQFDTGLQIPLKGEHHYQCKTNEQFVHHICTIFEVYGTGITSKEVCNILNIEYTDYHNGLIKHLRCKNSWKHICQQYKY